MNFSKEDVLEALGIEESNNWMVFALAGFGVGCLVGAGLALAFAPKSGRELRSDLMERGRDLVSKGQEYAQQMRGEMGREHMGREGREGMGMQPGMPPTTPTY